jgi:hypothetical protein
LIFWSKIIQKSSPLKNLFSHKYYFLIALRRKLILYSLPYCIYYIVCIMIVIRIRTIKMCVIVMKRATFPGAVAVVHFLRTAIIQKTEWLEYLMFKITRSVVLWEILL